MITNKLSITDQIRKAVPIILVLLLTLAGCASPGKVGLVQPGDASDSGKTRIVQPGDVADISYLCRLKTGEIVAATETPAENQLKSAVFVLSDKNGTVSVTAAAPFPELAGGKEMVFEDEIIYRLAGTVVGMKEGERRQAELTAQDIPERDEQNYVVRLARVRTRPKEMTMTADEYQYRTHKSPEVGQSFTLDLAFPGRVETVTDQGVVIRFYAKSGDTIKTPFGSGRIREEGTVYKVDIDARKGALVRTGPLVGRISHVDDKVIAIDFRHPFGYEALDCDVTVEKIAESKTAKSGKEE